MFTVNRSWQEDNIKNDFKVRDFYFIFLDIKDRYKVGDVSCKLLYLMDQNNKEPKLEGPKSIITFFFMRNIEANFIKKIKSIRT